MVGPYRPVLTYLQFGTGIFALFCDKFRIDLCMYTAGTVPYRRYGLPVVGTGIKITLIKFLGS